MPQFQSSHKVFFMKDSFQQFFFALFTVLVQLMAARIVWHLHNILLCKQNILAIKIFVVNYGCIYADI